MQSKIKSILHKDKWTNIEFEDGTKGSGNSEYDTRFKTLKEGQEIDYELKDGKWINLKKEAKSGNNFPKRDYTVEKKICALNASVTLVTHSQIKAYQLIPSAEKFYEWLNK